jgi:GntR family transcriptional regulator, glc operon transcriptional activator
MVTSKKAPYYHEVARQLEALILDRTLPPGSRLPSERQLAQRLQVSRPVVREALKELRGRGVIETRLASGSFVSEMLPSAETQAPLRNLFRDHSRAIFDLLEVREILEGQAAYYAALRLTTADQYRITQSFEAMADAREGRVELDAQLDHAFHKAISEATHNPFLVHTLQSLSQLLLDSVLTSIDNLYHRPEQRQMLMDQHTAIYKAIVSKDPEAARDAATDHIQQIRHSLRAIESEEHRLLRAQQWQSVLGEVN